MNDILHNIKAAIPEQLPKEVFETILQRPSVRIERILSKGHSTPVGQWYDQDWDEWILLIQGQATLVYQKESEPFNLFPGDYLLIPAHTRHRVEWTPSDITTIWLAIHLQENGTFLKSERSLDSTTFYKVEKIGGCKHCSCYNNRDYSVYFCRSEQSEES